MDGGRGDETVCARTGVCVKAVALVGLEAEAERQRTRAERVLGTPAPY
jgi:hypothetical protein